MRSPVELLTQMRRGAALTREELEFLIRGITDETLSDAQTAACAMAICKDGLSDDARIWFTAAMRDSGERLSWSVPGPLVDKHSTGGIGDAVSLVLAPALAACGAYVPMMSGRGLGHTGGTLDKLEAIPGLRTELGHAAVTDILAQCGCAIFAASKRLAPADRRLYAIRDHTGTVDSLDLITASILSKKLAAGLEHLVLDVKCGSAAWMKSYSDAEVLAQSLVSTSQALGLRAEALITRMDAPLLPNIGNALEICAVLSLLRGAPGTERWPIFTICQELGARLLVSAGLVDTSEAGRDTIKNAITTGQALEKFARFAAAQGGPVDLVERTDHYLGQAPIVLDVLSEQSGYLAAFEGETLGRIVVDLGGGRKTTTDEINPLVGLSDVVAYGAYINQGDILARIHASEQAGAEQAAAHIRDALYFANTPPEQAELVMGHVV